MTTIPIPERLFSKPPEKRGARTGVPDPTGCRAGFVTRLYFMAIRIRWCLSTEPGAGTHLPVLCCFSQQTLTNHWLQRGGEWAVFNIWAALHCVVGSIPALRGSLHKHASGLDMPCENFKSSTEELLSKEQDLQILPQEEKSTKCPQLTN